MSEGINTVTPETVRQELDKVLARQIIGKLDVDFDTAVIAFNLSTLSCVVVMVDREKEIQTYGDSPPERFTLDTLYRELADIGLENDVHLELAVESCVEKGYIRRLPSGELKAEMPAFMTAGFLDTMFPGMQGMNLIAFVLQMNEEVNSGRKSLELALKSFEASLESRSVAVTKDAARKKAREMAEGKEKATPQDRLVSKALKKDNLDRLSKLIKSRKKRDGYAAKMLVKDVFDKGPSREETESMEEEARKSEAVAQKIADLTRELAEKEEALAAARAETRQAELQIKSLGEKQEQLNAVQEKEAQVMARARKLEERERALSEREARLKEGEARLQKEEGRIRQASEALKADGEKAPVAPLEDQEDIESRIAAFESELTMPCPLCDVGEIVTSKTAKGKEYYSCTQPDCRFVSWDKPYHFSCPLCRNPFLTEAQFPTGEIGLKCPRASCSYTQKNLKDPKVNMVETQAANGPKKKKRVVRRVKRH